MNKRLINIINLNNGGLVAEFYCLHKKLLNIIFIFSQNYKKAIRDYISVIFGTGLSRCFTFLSSIIIARCIGIEGFGKFNLFYIILVLTYQFSESFDATFICYAKASNSADEKNNLLRSTLFIKVIYVVFLVLVLIPLGYTFARILFQNTEIIKFIILGIIAGSFLTFMMTIAHAYREKEEFVKFAILNLLYTTLIFFTLFILFSLDYKFNLTHVIQIYLIVTMAIGGISLWILLRRVGNIFNIDMHIIRKLVTFGKWIFVTSVVYYLFQKLDIFFMTHFVSFEDIGIYSAAVQLIMIVSLTTGALSTVFLPKSIIAVNSRKNLINYLKESVIPLSFILFIILLLWITAPYCIQITYGKLYYKATPILRILLIGWIFLGLFLPLSIIFLAIGDAKTRFYLQLSNLIIVAIFMFILVPRMGIIGGAISMSCSLGINTLISFVIIKMRLKKRFSFISVDI